MNNDHTDNQGDTAFARHLEVIRGMKSALQTAPALGLQSIPGGGLAELQKATLSMMNGESRAWGFANSPLSVKRQKIGKDLWKITVENPRTREIILEAQGQGDKMFAHEDNLARMAEALMNKELVIRTGSGPQSK